MQGQLGILNVGAGDTKLTFDRSNPVERDRACRIVTDMLKRGYAILVQIGEEDGDPIYRRARGFDPETAEYIIADAPAIDTPAVSPQQEDQEPAKDKATPRRRTRNKRVPAEGASAVAVGRTAGG